jgi:hypothetical protein
MRDANVQPKNIMGHADASQQAPPKHVSHAETGGFSEREDRELEAPITMASVAPC